MKMLYIHNQAKKVNNFSHSSMLAAQELGIEFHIASNWGYETEADRKKDEDRYGIKIHQIDFIRKPYDSRNIKAYKQVCELLEREKYDLIHCNTPIGGVIGRLAGKKCKVPKIIYQAHGFHFYKGASIFNWLIYYPIERWLAKYTDCLITINSEDFALAKNRINLKPGGTIEFVNGVGINLEEYRNIKVNKKELRESLGINEQDFVCISAGDLVKRKNYNIAIRALVNLNFNIKYLICGQGSEEKKLKLLVKKYNVEDRVVFLGYRSDVKELMMISDCFLFTSLQEGLPRSLMEAMSLGLPCVVSDVRGNVDLIKNEKGGILCDAKRSDNFSSALQDISTNYNKRITMGQHNLENIKRYDLSMVKEQIQRVYRKVL